MSWHLASVQDSLATALAAVGSTEARAKEAPTRPEREQLVFGDHAKLLFVSDDLSASERMWVTVTKVSPGPRYEGEVASVTLDIAPGLLVEFGPEHVCGVDASYTLASIIAREDANG